jgi:hypothetical protein
LIDLTDVLCAVLALLTIIGAIMTILSPLIALVWMREREMGRRPENGAAFPVITRSHQRSKGETGPQGFEP